MLAVVSNGPGLPAGQACPSRRTAGPSGRCRSELCSGACSGTSAAAAWTLPRDIPPSGTDAFASIRQGSDRHVSWCSPRTYTASFCNVIGVFFFFLAKVKLPLLEGTLGHLHVT